MRIVFLARKLDQGGTERQIVTLATALKNRGHDIHVVLFYRGGAFDTELGAANIPMYFIEKSGRWDLIKFIVRLTLCIHKLEPNIIYSFLDTPNILSALISPIIGRPKLVWSVRAARMEMHHYDWLIRTIPQIEARLSPLTDVVVANSLAGKEWAIERGFPAQKIIVIENGIDTNKFKFNSEERERLRARWGIGSKGFAIGLVARLDPMKDHQNFLKACALVSRYRDDLHFICVGGGPSNYLFELQQLAFQLGISDKIIWLGSVPNMPGVYSALDIVISSSIGEGFSNAVAEAMACERPCVVTDVGDSARIVGDLGVVVPPRDPFALANGIFKMIDRLKKSPDLGYQNRARIVNNFSVQRMVLLTEKMLLGIS